MELVTDINSIDLKKLMKDPKSAIELMHLFISQNFVSTFAYEVAKRQLYAFISFCRSASYLPIPSILERILKENPLFDETVALIVKINEKWITSGKVGDLFTDDIFLIIIETYCALNNIEIKEEEEEIICDDDDEVFDSDRMYLREIGKKPLLNPEEERMYLKKVKEGDKEAEKIVVERNLRYVVRIAKKYTDRGLPFLDLIQEGNIGLMKAIRKFDFKKDCKLSTYAKAWIRAAITRAITNTSRTVRYPVYLDTDLSTYKKCKEGMEKRTGKEAKPIDIALELGITEAQAIDFERLIQLEEISSLNSYVKDGERDAEVGDFIPSEEITPEEQCLKESLKIPLIKLIDACCITEREKEILLYRFPINGGEEKSEVELAKMFGVTHQRIGAIVGSAIRHIVKNKETFRFAQWMEDPKEAQEHLRKGREFYADPRNRYKIFSENAINELSLKRNS